MIVEKYTKAATYNWEDRRYTPEQQPQGGGYRLPDGSEAPVGKPMGGWISVPDSNIDWPSWCKAEEFSLDSLQFVHTYELDTSGVKLITQFDEICDFHREYGVDARIAPQFARYNIQWDRVARDFGGIVIAHYFWSCRLGSMDGNREDITNQISNWYYGWDCASGCIWNPDLLTHIETKPYDATRRARPLQLEENEE